MRNKLALIDVSVQRSELTGQSREDIIDKKNNVIN